MAKNGANVRVHYKGFLDDGTIFDSSEGGEPLEFVVGSGMVIPGFDSAVASMEVGDTKTVHIPCAEAYGEYREELVGKRPLAELGATPEQLPVGQTIYFRGPGGQPLPAKVLAVEDGIATFDFNHNLAGKDLNFELTLVEVVE